MSATSGVPAVILLGRLATLARHARLIREARRRGYAPIAVVGYAADAARLAVARARPGHPLADLADAVGVPDAAVDTVVAAVQPVLRTRPIAAVLSTGEPFLEPAAVLAELLDLPGPGWAAARICRNKLLQRTRLPWISPRWRPAAPLDVDGFGGVGFPAVVKPAGRFQSSGVRAVRDPAELADALAALPAGETVLVEERVDGREYSVEALVREGRIIWSGVTGKETNENHRGSFFTELSHTSPACGLTGPEHEALLTANAEVLRGVDVRTAMTHAEFRLTDDGPVLMEVAARAPGDGITLMWELATGVPLEPVLLDLALGVPTGYPEPRRRVHHRYLPHPRGRLRDVAADVPVHWLTRDDRWPEPEPSPATAPPRCHAVLVSRLPGDLLGEQSDSTQRSVSVLVDAPLEQSVEAVAAAVAARVRVDVQ
ncbi:acetyl-CoA carboxylase biotin carboxylase subunit family protein [Plantactinospora sp. BB1]|uniref:ATP-grasp domain-containing protein n=1 Tax=Plantactinospora sp. BB1 TaxID=2071627 RepID=UPI000D15653D|nr:ATP-grasp domain-containing protein [Plantactinospora sp. BB1]AVT38307.1 biotin carboxylase [Plantactinospora sp. BB1]